MNYAVNLYAAELVLQSYRIGRRDGMTDAQAVAKLVALLRRADSRLTRTTYGSSHPEAANDQMGASK